VVSGAGHAASTRPAPGGKQKRLRPTKDESARSRGTTLVPLPGGRCHPGQRHSSL